ncbi:MAG: hypothetical protein AB9860_04045 [Methanomassiliicoccales archaeon]
MKLPLVATRLGILAFKLMVAAIVILSILPLLTGGIGLDIENGDEGGMTLEGSTISMEMPITVRNDGFFDINDLTVSFTFMNEEGDVLAVSEGDPMDIPAGEETEVAIAFALDLLDLDQQVRSDLIFNGTEMMFDAKISAKYTLDMVQLSVEAGSDMGWGPFISDLQVEEWNAYANEEGDDRFVNVPFHFRADDVLNGLQTFTVTEYRDEDGYTSNVTQSVYLSQQVNEMAKIPLSQEAYDRLMNGTANATVRTTVYILDCSTYDEGYLNLGGGGGGEEPIRNLQLQMSSSVLQEDIGSYFVIIPFSFQVDSANQDQYANVLVEYWDSQSYYTSAYQMVYLDEYGYAEIPIWISPVAYDNVINGNEMVHVKVTMYYQSWTLINEQDYNEPWGV